MAFYRPPRACPALGTCPGARTHQVEPSLQFKTSRKPCRATGAWRPLKDVLPRRGASHPLPSVCEHCVQGASGAGRALRARAPPPSQDRLPEARRSGPLPPLSTPHDIVMQPRRLGPAEPSRNPGPTSRQLSSLSPPLLLPAGVLDPQRNVLATVTHKARSRGRAAGPVMSSQADEAAWSAEDWKWDAYSLIAAPADARISKEERAKARASDGGKQGCQVRREWTPKGSTAAGRAAALPGCVVCRGTAGGRQTRRRGPLPGLPATASPAEAAAVYRLFERYHPFTGCALCSLMRLACVCGPRSSGSVPSVCFAFATTLGGAARCQAPAVVPGSSGSVAPGSLANPAHPPAFLQCPHPLPPRPPPPVWQVDGCSIEVGSQKDYHSRYGWRLVRVRVVAERRTVRAWRRQGSGGKCATGTAGLPCCLRAGYARRTPPTCRC